MIYRSIYNFYKQQCVHTPETIIYVCESATCMEKTSLRQAPTCVASPGLCRRPGSGAFAASTQWWFLKPGRRQRSSSSTPDKLMSGSVHFCTRPHAWFLAWASLVSTDWWRPGFPETRLVNQREVADHANPFSCLGDSELDLQGGHTYFWWAPSLGLPFVH